MPSDVLGLNRTCSSRFLSLPYPALDIPQTACEQADKGTTGAWIDPAVTMAATVNNAFGAISLLEWDIASELTKNKIPLSNTIGFESTVLPDILFSCGLQKRSAVSSALCLGVGIAQSRLNSESRRVFGLLQRCGLASLIAAQYGDSIIGPSTMVAIWQFLSIYMAKDSKRPYKSVSATGQSAIDKRAVGSEHMLNPDYDPDGVLPTLMTTVSIWLGQWVADNYMSTNESFVMALSLMSLGCMSSYAFPNLYPYSQTFWTLSYTFCTSGFSLLKFTGVRVLVKGLQRYPCGTTFTDMLNKLGSHTLELFLIQTSLNKSGILQRLKNKSKNWHGKVLATVARSAVVVSSALVLNQILY